MKLTLEDKRFLKDQCFEDDVSIEQIERATRKTKYEYDDGIVTRKISEKEAINILGRNEWLAGMDRAAFHSDATVCVDGMESAYVYFDSSAFFGH